LSIKGKAELEYTGTVNGKEYKFDVCVLDSNDNIKHIIEVYHTHSDMDKLTILGKHYGYENVFEIDVETAMSLEKNGEKQRECFISRLACCVDRCIYSKCIGDGQCLQEKPRECGHNCTPKIKTDTNVEQGIDIVIPFGKYKGQHIKDVSPEYLKYLSCWDVYLNDLKRVIVNEKIDDIIESVIMNKDRYVSEGLGGIRGIKGTETKWWKTFENASKPKQISMLFEMRDKLHEFQAGPVLYLYSNHPRIIKSIRNYITQNNLCLLCFKKMRNPIHAWYKLHKKCWKELIE